MQPVSTREARRLQNFSRELAEKGWYHSFELPDGTRIEGFCSLESLRERYRLFPIPPDLTAKRVLDIGAWDGWSSFEAERRGASVTAIDCIEVEHFLEIRRRLASKVDYRILDVYDLPRAGLGRFDIVFFLGVLYHLKHPLLALEIVCELTTDIALVDSFVIDPTTWQDHRDDIPVMEFYETNELGEQLDNWNGPTVGCLLAMCRAAGFARVDLLRVDRHHALVACHRRWAPPPNPPQPPPELAGIMNSRTFGINVPSTGDQYVTCWFRTPRAALTREEVGLEVDDFGVRALYLWREDDLWFANFRLPPGLTRGWKRARVLLGDTGFSNAVRLAVDMPLRGGPLELRQVYDGASWKPAEVEVRNRGHLSCWVKGLPENADRYNVRSWLGDMRLIMEWVGGPEADGFCQVNALVPAGMPKGVHQFRLECAGFATSPLPVRVI